MHHRFTFHEEAPEAYKAVRGLEDYIRANVEHTLLHLIKLRASVVNGCSFCVDMHTRDALADGEDARRLFAVSAWREAPFFDERERAALALTDAVTELGPDGVPDDVWDPVAALWDRKAIADLLTAIATINVWNRLMVSTRTPPPVTA
ncbi:AhpD family alkylhydroperoxidase [Haloactinopolyspora alba]|uniref:AhpD family alkylhydroperoxidase n=1 Tax=Haloactinopolyspora alba TaxID=648780 RepID=A0A2P8EGE8_9ACTN|nr:carboxymuconolactone decarboxylase family protein [Haloactinopolyspora alba]PSL08537.1 AhpD family alkylhydroperoxidase [Haloactinopolyspora alba]